MADDDRAGFQSGMLPLNMFEVHIKWKRLEQELSSPTSHLNIVATNESPESVRAIDIDDNGNDEDDKEVK